MRVKNKTFTEDEINQYCLSVDKLLKSINEKNDTKKPRKRIVVEEEQEEKVMSDEDLFVLS